MSGADLKRYDEMARLKRPGYQTMEDAEQVAYLEQWHIDHQGDYSGHILLVAAGIIMTVAAVCYLRLSAPSTYNITPCTTCHNGQFYPPADLTTYKKYRTFHANKVTSTTSSDDQLLAELVRP